jgi:Ca-activated chloride channel family protein
MQHKVLVDYELAVAQQGFIVRALLELKGKAPSPDNRIPLNLSIVLDRSGSMGGEKLSAARDAAAMLIRRLHPDDVVSVVAYDDEVITVADPATGDAQAALPRLVHDIGEGGSTNLSGGWLRGRELVARGMRAGGVNRVVLLTDGLANVGITEPTKLLGLCRTACGGGITTTTIGFGADYDEKLLRGMADAGGASTWYIERPDQASDVFAEELEGLLTLCAQTVSVEIRPSDAVTLTAVRHQYPTTALGTGARLELGDLYAREPKSVLVEFFVPALLDESGDAGDVAIAHVALTAHVLTEAGGVERQEITFPVIARLTAAGHAEPEVRREMLLLDAAKAREDALRLRDEGDFGGAATVLREISTALSSDLSGFDDVAVAELREQAVDLAEMASTFAAQEVSEEDAKYLAQRAYNAHRGKRAYEAKLSRAARPRPADRE